MAHDPLNLADMVKINDVSVADYNVSDLFDDCPFLRLLPAVEASHGTVHKYLVENGAPTVGFRAVNVGREMSSSSDRLVTADLFILDASFEIDKPVADSFVGGAEKLIQREAIRHLKAALFKYEQQIFRGVKDGSASGFGGFNDALNTAGSYPNVNAGGSTNRTSAYMVRSGEGHVQLVLGNGMNIEVGDSVSQSTTDASGNKYPVYFTPVTAYVGLEIGTINSVGRIMNMVGTEGATANVLTDTLLSRLLEKFPAGRAPNIITTNKRMRGALQRSRTTYSPTGAPAPLPQEYEGIPMVVSDGVMIGESNPDA